MHPQRTVALRYTRLLVEEGEPHLSLQAEAGVVAGGVLHGVFVEGVAQDAGKGKMVNCRLVSVEGIVD